MIKRYTCKNLTWVDIESPTAEEVKTIMDEYGIHPIIAEGLLMPGIRPKVEEYGDLLYIEMHMPTMSKGTHSVNQQEVDFVIGQNFLITSHYDMIDGIHNFSKIFEVNSILDKTNMGDHGGYLFFHLMKTMYTEMGLEIDTLRANVKTVEVKIFKGNQKELVETLSEIGHKLLDFREATRFHKSILASFELSAKKMFGEEYLYYSTILTSEFYKVWEILENLRETVVELKKTNDSLLAYKTNRTIEFLTVISFLTLPLTVIPDFFTTNVFVHGHYSANMIHAMSILCSAVLYTILRYKKIF
jgi:magnesium transporter